MKNKQKNVALATNWNKISLNWSTKITKPKTEIKIISREKTNKNDKKYIKLLQDKIKQSNINKYNKIEIILK